MVPCAASLKNSGGVLPEAARILPFDDAALEAASGTGFYRWDTSEDRLTWSPGLLRIYGLDKSPTAASSFTSLVHPDDRSGMQAKISALLGTDAQSFSHEFRIVRPDGNVRFVIDRGAIERDAQGRVTTIRGVIIDITERQKSQDSVDRLHIASPQGLDALEALYAEAPLGLGMLDRDLRFVRINRALAEANGFSIEEHIGRTVWDLVPDLRATAEPAMQRVLDTGVPLRDLVIRGETPARPGAIREWRSHYYPVFGSDGIASGIGMACEEVTDRVALERANAELQARLAAALRAGRMGVHEFHPSSGKIIWDEEVRNIWGVSADEPVSYETFVAGVHPDDLPGAEAALAAALDPTGSGRFEAVYRVIHPTTGGARYVRADGDVSFDGDVPVRLVGTVKDVTERQEAEARLRAAHDTFRHLVDRSPFGVYAVDADFRLVQVSDGAQKVFENVRPLIGRDFAEVLRIVWAEPFASEAIALFRHTLATGEPYHAPSTVERRGDIGTTEAYDWKIERIALPTGPGVVCHFYDLSERQAFEQKIQFLMHEVNHRAKNMLSVVDAVARQTASAGQEGFIGRFSERVGALAASQELLMRTDWEGSRLDALVESQLLPFKDLIGNRIRIDGPAIDVGPGPTQTLGMALHELATNAAKYGALSNTDGQVAISWHIVDDNGVAMLIMTWIESDGPIVTAPTRAGFGGRVARTIVEKALSGSVTVEYAQTGLRWALRCPLARIMASRHTTQG